jgi:hypothetical protein
MLRLRLLSVNRPRTAEIQDSQFANITSQTKSFIYYDSYIQLANLTPNTEYTMFMMPQDLSGNNGNIKSITFKTAPVPPAVTFKLKSSAAISDDKLLQALSLVAGLTVDKIKITYKPIFSSIPTTEPEVDSVLKSKNMEYEIMITPDATIDGKTPYDYLKKIEDEKDTLFEELPSLDPTQSISATGKEMTYDTQKFAYKPKLIEVSNFHALFNISIFYSGTVYGIILPANEERPSAAQIKDGLTSVNRQVIDKYFTKASIQLQDDKNYQVQPSATMNFTFLYHSSKYVAYFIAERDTLGDPVLMKDSEVLDAPLTTLREIFRVEDSVVELNSHSTTITASWIFIGLLLLIQFIN